MSKYDHLSKDELVRVLEARDRRDATRFGLVWEANEIERDNAINSDFVALDLIPEHSTGNAPWENLIIEGDNFDALRHLRMCYAGRVKCIYIDPPYNTGNRDFVYNDRFVDANDAWRHSTWIEFMYQRLILAKDLLAQDGVIFVSIDDNEVFALGLLMNKVFGEGNFVANVIWQKTYSPKSLARHFSTDHDFILVYALNGDVWRPNILPRTEAQNKSYKNPDKDPRGNWKSSDLSMGKPYSKGNYSVITPSGRMIAGPPPGRLWAVSKEKFDELDADNRIWWGQNGDNMPSLKRFLTDVIDGRVPQTLWPYTEVGHTQDAKKELLSILDFSDSTNVFSTPKPVALIERILRISAGPNDLILDFFAGSGTTAHAVLKLNAEDGGKRRFILVSNTEATSAEPEKNLCRDVCARRVRRVIEGYGDTPGLPGNFAYLRCRQITPEKLLEIEHAQVWTALQLLHCGTILPFEDSAGFLWTGDEHEALAYVPRFTPTFLPALRKAVRKTGTVTIYSWQPELLRQRVRSSHAQHAAIPESLVRKFGLRNNQPNSL